MPNHNIEKLQAAIKSSKPLYSIFDRVVIKKERQFNPQKRSELPKVLLTADGLANDFRKLEEADLEDDLKLLNDNLRPDAHDATLPYLFQKYGWRIAGPEDAVTDKYPDAAFCDTYRAKQALEKPGDYLLVKGDLTGIQEYIYGDIQPKQAGGLGNLSKRLRARSVLVSLLTDFVANVILRELEMSFWQLLFAGGGHFNLLLQIDKEKELDDLSKKLSVAMRQRFGEHLELIIAWVPCSKDDLEKNASRQFEAVNAKRDWLKRRQHLGKLEDFFKKPEETIDENEKRKEREKKEQRIGGEFPKQHFVIEVTSKKSLSRYEPDLVGGDLILAEFSGLKYYHTLLAAKFLDEAQENYSAHRFLSKNKDKDIEHAQILALNNTNFLPEEDWKSDFNFPVSFGFRFLGKNAPKQMDENKEEIPDGDILDFEALAKLDQEEKKKGEGFLRLGALMLDVDDLGLIFSHGFGKDATLPRIITLSRELNYFFTAHFDQRAHKHKVYVVYSGGDDAFVVGKWDKLIRFIEELHSDFQKFIRFEENQNKDVHFSAGLFMSNPFYPIGRFYRDVRNLQNEKAKKAEGKNAVDVFDYTLKWDSYADKIVLGDQFRDVLKKGKTGGGRKFSASFAYRIMQLVKTSYYERNEWQREGEQIKFEKRGHLHMDNFARNVARMRYLFARNGFSEDEIQKLTDKLERDLTDSFLKKAFDFNAKYEPRDYLVALNFAMLQVRSKTKTPEYGQ